MFYRNREEMSGGERLYFQVNKNILINVLEINKGVDVVTISEVMSKKEEIIIFEVYVPQK